MYTINVSTNLVINLQVVLLLLFSVMLVVVSVGKYCEHSAVCGGCVCR